MADTRYQDLLAMGFEENIIRAAISICPAGTLEDTVGCIVMLSEQAEDLTPAPPPTAASSGPLKMVLVVRMDLNMSPGKIAAQCVHAALGCVRNSNQAEVDAWESMGEATICLKCNTLDEMNTLRIAANNAGLCTYFVRDAGRTEVEPGSQTVLAIGPAALSRIDSVTGRLKLL
jgi:PTH2 family peptidyl-tRNA hydrolase